MELHTWTNSYNIIIGYMYTAVVAIYIIILHFMAIISLIQYTEVWPFVPRLPTFHFCCKSAGLQANYKSQLGRPAYEARISPLNEGMIRG